MLGTPMCTSLPVLLKGITQTEATGGGMGCWHSGSAGAPYL